MTTTAPRKPRTAKATAGPPPAPAATAPATAADVYVRLPVADVDAAGDNVRDDLGDLTDLAASIRAHGLVHPLLVTYRDGRAVVVAGHRRLAAARDAGLDEVPCIVRDLDEAARVEIMVLENVQRSDLTPLEEARAYQRLAGLGHSQRRIADQVGRSQGHVSKRLSLLDLPAPVLDRVADGGITVRDAEALARLDDTPPERIVELVEAPLTWAEQHTGQADIERRIADDQAERARAARRNAAIARLQGEGLMVVDRDEYFSYSSREKRLGRHFQEVNITPAKHKRLPCHRVLVDRAGGEHLVCARPTSHPEYLSGSGSGQTGPLSDAAKAERAEQRDRTRQLRDAAEARREPLARVVADAARRRPDVLDHIARALAGGAEARDLWGSRIALDVAGVAKPDGGWGYEGEAKALREWAGGYGEHAHLALAAVIALGFVEHRLRDRGPTRGDQLEASHYRLLADRGHEPTPVERASARGDLDAVHARPADLQDAVDAVVG